MEEEKKVSEETKANMQRATPYSKLREEDDAETEESCMEQEFNAIDTEGEVV